MNTRLLLASLPVSLALVSCQSAGRGELGGAGGLKTPANAQTPITATEIKALLAERSVAAEKYRVRIELVRAGKHRPETSTVDLRPGQRGKVERVREFPYPTEFRYPAVSDPGISKATSPVTPLTPDAFESKKLGWWCDVSVEPRGSIVELKGDFEEVAFDGFASVPGEVSRPITTPDGRMILTDNKALQPRFTRRESPLVVFAVPGKTYRMDVNSSARRAWLNISIEPVSNDKSGQPAESHRLAAAH